MKLPESEHIVFFGNSHIECAINDTILKNCFNFGRSGERMEYIYSKVKVIQHYNSNFDTIVIGFDNVLLTHDSKKGITPSLYSPYFFDTYTIADLFQMTTNGSFEYTATHLYHPFNYLKYVDVFLGKECNIHKMNNLGGYLYLYRDKLELDIKKRGNIKYKTTQFDYLSCYFLDATVRFCKKNGIKVIFLFPPQHRKCPLDSTYYKQFYNAHYSDIPFYDFRDMSLQDSCFGDLDHLNHKGAAVFSEYLERNVFHKNNYPQTDTIN